MTSLRILVVDDDPTMLLICRRYFSTLPGVEITEASSGEEAIELLRATSFDCVLSDHRMAAVTGIEVLAFAKTQRPKAVRIMMSGYADPRLVGLAHAEASVHEFIEKPMTTEEMHKMLREVVAERYLKPLAASRQVGAV